MVAAVDDPEPWVDEVEDHRDTLEAWANSDLPLADAVAELLRQADDEGARGG